MTQLLVSRENSLLPAKFRNRGTACPFICFCWRLTEGRALLQYQSQKTFGALLAKEGVYFRLWAPNQVQVFLVMDERDPVSMHRSNDGWHELLVPDAKVGSRYKFRLGDGLEVPDPASRFQPADVHGPSEVIDPHGYQWNDGTWTGRPWEESVIYEVHIGAFTQEGTFRSAIDRLDYLADLGVTAIEIMPVAATGDTTAYCCSRPIPAMAAPRTLRRWSTRRMLEKSWYSLTLCTITLAPMETTSLHICLSLPSTTRRPGARP